jgi:predicted transcriptional regulator
MRTLVDIAAPDIAALDGLALKREQARAVLIREAISDYLARHGKANQADAFGLWSSRIKDGLVFQEAIRSEW